MIIVSVKQISNHDVRLAQLQFSKKRDKNKLNEGIRKKRKKRKIFEPLISIVSSHRNWFLYRILYLKYEVSRKIVSWKLRYPSLLPPFNIDFASRARKGTNREPTNSTPFWTWRGYPNLGSVKPIQTKLGFGSHEISIRVNNSYTVSD